MKKNWTALALALTLATSLTACGYRDGNGTTGNNSGTGSDITGSAGKTRNGMYNSVTGRAGYNSSLDDFNDYNATRRSAYDNVGYGRYGANADGRVYGTTNSAARDFTQDARDMMRDTGNAARDVGNGVTNATRNAMNY